MSINTYTNYSGHQSANRSSLCIRGHDGKVRDLKSDVSARIVAREDDEESQVLLDDVSLAAGATSDGIVLDMFCSIRNIHVETTNTSFDGRLWMQAKLASGDFFDTGIELRADMAHPAGGKLIGLGSKILLRGYKELRFINTSSSQDLTGLTIRIA